MQFTAQRQQKAANTSLLESRNLLQTATLVFPRSIVCSRLSNNINILPKIFFQAANGGAMPPLDPPLNKCNFLHSALRVLILGQLPPLPYEVGAYTCNARLQAIGLPCWKRPKHILDGQFIKTSSITLLHGSNL